MPLPFLVAFLLPGSADPDAAVSATVWVRAGNRATGAGWVIDREGRRLVTARHVVGDLTSVEVTFYTTFAGLPLADRDGWFQSQPLLKCLGRVATAKVLAAAKDADLVLLEADHLPPDVPALRLATAAPAGTKAHCVGHRHDAPGLWVRTDGAVRQAGRLGEGYFWAGRKLGLGADVLFAQLPVEAGDSGAAVVGPDLRVLGVVSAFDQRTPGLTILTAADEVRRLVAEAGGEKRGPREPTKPPDLARGTVWVRPSATDGRYAGVLVDYFSAQVLTSATAVGAGDVVDVIFPVMDPADGHLIAEVEAYRDRLGLSLSRHLVRAVVLARDPGRDLALLELLAVPDSATTRVPVANTDPRVGAAVYSVSHPPGLELLWLSAAGTVRGIGATALQRNPPGDATKFPSLLLQLPHQGSAAGGPVVNDRGELVGILAGREGARQDLGFSASTADVRAFLDSARPLTTPRTASEWHRRGTYLDALGDSKGAIIAYGRAVAYEPGDAGYQADYALVAAENGSAESVRGVLARLEALSRRSADVDATLAAAYLAAGMKEESRQAADRALMGNPGQPLARVVRSAFLPTAEAVRALDQVIADHSNYARAYRERAGRLRSESAAREQALADVSRAVELAPYDARARTLRAEVLVEMKEWKKAVREYARLVEDRPAEAPQLAYLAYSHLNAGEDGRAVEALGDLVRLGSTAQKSAYTIVRAHGDELIQEDRGNPRRALEWQLRALKAIELHLPAEAGRRRVDDLLRSVGKLSASDAVGKIAGELKGWEGAK